MNRTASRPRPPGARRFPAALRRLPLWLAALALAGCAINPPARLPSGEMLRLEGVPFHPQTEYQCGPAALAGLLGAAGVETSPETLRSQVYLPKRRGSLQLELVAATRRAGRIPYQVEPEFEALLDELQAGRPVLVLQNLWTPSVPRWHYAVLVGSDPARNRVLLNTGRREARPTGARSFLRTWDWGGRWGLVALRPGELPAQARPLRYIEAVAAFEPVAGPEAAKPAWEAAVQRWPQEPRPYLALGNLAYAGGDPRAALDWFGRGLRAVPGEPVLANNHASVLAELGCPLAAREALAPVLSALPSDSPWRDALTRTAADLAARTGPDGAHCAGLAAR